MRTDLRALAETHVDLLIVGGGVHGLFAAYDAASRGLSVALIERGDFGSGLSFNHQRTIHGGLRDLAAGRVRKARHQLVERRRWVQMAPHLIAPAGFVLGTTGWTSRSRLALTAGLTVYERLARSTTSGVPSALRLAPARTIALPEVARLSGGLARAGLSGGALWYDYQTRFPDRLNWTIALAAMAAGASLTSYVEAVAPLRDRGRVVGARVRDLATGVELDVPASMTLLAAGSGLGELAPLFGVSGELPFVRAMNLLLDRPAPPAALAEASPTGRMLTVVPWHGHALVGTYQSESAVDPAEPGVPPSAVTEMIAQVNATFPALGVALADIRLIQSGAVPAEVMAGRLELKPDPEIVRCSERGVPGLVVLIGVKFTGARSAAELAIDAVCAERQVSTRQCVTGLTPLPHAGVVDRVALQNACLRATGTGLDPELFPRLMDEYGSEAPDVLAFSTARGLLARVAPGTDVIGGEIAYAAERSAAVRLADVVQRRTTLGAARHPGRAALVRAAAIMGAIRGWTPEQQDAEVRHAEDRYRVPGRNDVLT